MATSFRENLISFVIPARDEEASITELIRQITQVAETEGLSIEIIAVDDGSRDGTWRQIDQAANDDRRVRGIRLRRNFGKAAALTAGFAEARGAVVFTLDADLQDDPREIPRFLDKLEQGYDSVTGWKRRRHDPSSKVLPSRVFNRLVSAISGLKLHDHNCGFKCHRAAVLREIYIYGEQHRFIPVLAHARGFRVGEIEVNHRPRVHGHSKYGAERFVKGSLDVLTVTFLTGFSQRPLHALGTVGLLAFGLGAAGLAYLAGYWFLQQFATQPLPIGQRPLLFYSLGGLLLGAQMLSIGVLAELITAHGVRDHQAYSIAETTTHTAPVDNATEAR